MADPTAPAAPSLDDVFNPEDHVEPFFQRGLAAAGIVEVDPERGSAPLSTPRVEVELHLGACVARNYRPPAATDPRECLPSSWDCTLQLTVVTDRVNLAQTGVHGLFRAKVRRFVAQFYRGLNPLLPFHEFERLVEGGTTPHMINDEARTEDVSRIVFHGGISVRPTAWPAAS